MSTVEQISPPQGGPATALAAPAVFISYSSTDSKIAEEVCTHLQKARIECWMAPRSIPGGAPYAARIVQAIDGARLMVLVFSPAANASDAVLKEVELASHRGIPILPLMIERTTPSGGMEYYIRSRHWRDAFSGPLADSLRALEADVRLHLSRDPRLDPPRRMWRRLMNQLGGPTVSLLGILALLGLQLWVASPRLAPVERRLGAAALVVALACCLAVRWRGIFDRRLPVVALKVSVVAALVGAWATASVLTHRVPTFSSGRMGILVARLAGDGDRQQRLLAELEAFVETSSAIDDGAIEVEELPRRLSKSEEARRVARATGAMVVVWGRVAAGLLQAHVTMADGEGLYDARGPILADTDLDVDEATANVEKVIVSFLRAYRVYEKRDYAAAIERFTETLAAVPRRPDGRDAAESTPREAALSSIHFYRATARYNLFLKTAEAGLREAAIQDYRESIRYASVGHSSISAFATPVANLAGILLSSRRPGDADEAARRLAGTACDTGSAPPPIPCLYVEYQRGVLENYRGRYAAGRAILDHLLTVSWPAAASALPPDSPHRLLLAYAYRNRAYSHARLGDANPASNRQEYERADEDWREAERRLVALGATVPADWFLTRARIEVGMRRLKEAKSALATAVARGVADPGIHLVAVSIAECEGDEADRSNEEVKYIWKVRTLFTDQPSEFEKLKREAAAQWAAFAELCRPSQEVRP